jgi:hypothetical protein
MLNVLEILRGCPTGATRAALNLNGCDDSEIAAAVAKGLVDCEWREYSNPRGYKLEWFCINKAADEALRQRAAMFSTGE